LSYAPALGAEKVGNAATPVKMN